MNISFEKTDLRQRPSKIWEIVILSSILLVALLVPPFYQGGFTLCLFRNITGLPCPGCGMTRAFLFLGHGDFYEAIRLNPNSPLIFSIIVFLWFNKIVYMATGKEVRAYLTKREKVVMYLLFGFAMVAGWVYNLLLNPYL